MDQVALDVWVDVELRLIIEELSGVMGIPYGGVVVGLLQGGLADFMRFARQSGKPATEREADLFDRFKHYMENPLIEDGVPVYQERSLQ